MPIKFKNIVKELVPPLIFRMLGRLLGRQNKFVGPFKSWEEAVEKSSGYDQDLILDRVLKSTMKVMSGEAAGERDSVALREADYTWPVTSGLMCAASSNQGRLHVLDFGGALGSAYFQNRKLLDFTTEFSWSVVEQPNFADAGRTYVQDKSIKFYDSISECLLANTPNVILLGSVLQYLKEPSKILRELAKTGALIIIDRTPISENNNEFILVQKVPAEIYPASYPIRILSEKTIVPPGYVKVAQFQSPEGRMEKNDCSFIWRGFFLLPTTVKK